MISKIKEKQSAIRLRNKGLSYNEILKMVSVAKSTLSVWLKDAGVAKKHEQRFTEKRRQAQIKAQQACREKRIKITEKIKALARNEIGRIDKRNFWLIGAALYWAEGSKQKKNNVSQGVVFSNPDPLMVNFFLQWLLKVLNIPQEQIYCELFIHENHRNRHRNIINFWSKLLKVPKEKFKHVYFKKNLVKTVRNNFQERYFGLIRIRVRRSTNLNRKISGWIEGICNL